MAINKITLDGQQYSTWKGTYVVRRPRHASERYTITGQRDRMDAGLAKWEWRMTLAIPDAATYNAFWATAAKKSSLSFTDIDGSNYTVYLQPTGDIQRIGMDGTHWLIPIELHEA